MKLSNIFLPCLAAVEVLAAPTEQLSDDNNNNNNNAVLPVNGNGRRSTDMTVQQPWGGAVQKSTGWTSVTGTTIIPSVAAGQNKTAAASAWVGIDGASCSKVILQTGVTLHGDGTAAAWYEWYPALPTFYTSTQFAVKSGDKVRMTVTATSATAGSSMLENLTTGKNVTTPFKDQPALCQTDAEWIIELGGKASDLVNFGTWSFTAASAAGSGSGTVSPQGARITNIEANNQTRTSCSADAKGVSCTWQ